MRFSGADVTTGAVVGLGKLEGKPVVVTVWASWCAACPKQAEPLRRFVAANDRVAVLAVDTQEDAEAARAFLTANDLSLPTIADEDGQYRGEARRPRAADDALSDERPSGRDHVGRPGRDRAPQIGRARRCPCGLGVLGDEHTLNVRAIVLLEDEPRFRPFPFALPNTPALASSIRNAERLLSRSPGRFDGPIAFCHGVSPDGAVLRRSGRYAEAMVVFEEPTLAYKLGFALGVQLFVEREEGVVLFQLRAASIGRDPLLWTASASGGLMPREEPRTAVLADAAEEVAFREDDLEGFRPVALCLNDDSGSALVVYHARLRSGAEPVPDETKVAELHWAASPSEIGAQVSGDTVACWAALERWRESLREGAPRPRPLLRNRGRR